MLHKLQLSWKGHLVCPCKILSVLLPAGVAFASLPQIIRDCVVAEWMERVHDAGHPRECPTIPAFE